MVLSSLHRLQGRTDDQGPAPIQRMRILCALILVYILGSMLAFWIGAHPEIVAAVDPAQTHLRSQTIAVAASLDMDVAQIDSGDPALIAALDKSPAVQAAEQGLRAAQQNIARSRARLGGFAAALLIVGYFLVFSAPRLEHRQEVTNAVTLMVLLTGLVLLASRLVVQPAFSTDVSVVGWGLVDIVVLQLAVCLTLPWTSREVAIPFAPLLVVWAGTFLLPGSNDISRIDRVVMVIMSPLVLAPGALIAAWRFRRAEEDQERRELGQRVESFGGELSRARIVHEAMFPDTLAGHVAFEYEYQPIQEIGGDYVHVHDCADTGRVTLTLLDVAGHGLAAALTVNRLFGELERILAENAAADPGEIMMLLNRYINLTMARHSLYATGTCMNLDPRSGTLTWVSAGHPPSLLRHADGRVEELATTTMLLGALESSAFSPGTRRITLQPGDTVIAFTDGAFEARNEHGEQFGLKRVRETAGFSPPPRSWPKFIAGAVAQHHNGHGDDDVLIAAMSLRSLRIEQAVPKSV